MQTKTRLWWGAAALSISALMLSACGDNDGEDTADTDDTTAEETDETTADEAAEEDTADEDDDGDSDDSDTSTDDAAGATALEEDEIRGLLLTEDELPVEVEQFESEMSLSEGEALTVPDADTVETCDELAEMMQDPQLAEDLAESGEDVDIAGLFSMGMWNFESADPNELGMVQTGVMSHSEELTDHQDDYALIRECEDETFTIEEEGVQMEMNFEYIEHGDWEGMRMLMSSSMDEMTFDMDMDILTYEDGTNVLFVGGTGEGKDYVEEIADLQLDKYEAGL